MGIYHIEVLGQNPFSIDKTKLQDLKEKSIENNDDGGVIYTGNPEILKKICPGEFGTIKPVGYCMIGKR